MHDIRGFIVRGSLLSVVLRVAGVILAYASQVVISRLLGVRGYGTVAIVLSWALVLTLAARFGFDQTALRYVTMYLENGQTARLRAFIHIALASVAASSIVLGIAFIGIGSAMNAAPTPVLVAAGLIILPQAMLAVMSVLVRSAREIFASQFYDQVFRPALLVVLLLLFASGGRAIRPGDVLMLTAAACFVALGALTMSFRRVFAHARTSLPDYSPVSQWFAVGVPLLIISFTFELLNQVEVIILGIIGNAHEAGLFAAAWRLASMVVLALSTFGLVCGPVVASAYHRGDLVELNRIVQFAARLTTASAVVAIAVLVVAGKFLLHIFGSEFVDAYPSLLALLAGGAVNAGTGIVVYLMTLTGHERVAVLVFAIAVLISVGLNLLLIPLLGTLGAAIASSATVSSWNIAIVVYVRRVFGIDATVLGRPLRRVDQASAA